APAHTLKVVHSLKFEGVPPEQGKQLIISQLSRVNLIVRHNPINHPINSHIKLYHSRN
ncbi:hypothetical protein LINPERPRIM_LOCUS25322, partial [Linum perenne]